MKTFNWENLKIDENKEYLIYWSSSYVDESFPLLIYQLVENPEYELNLNQRVYDKYPYFEDNFETVSDLYPQIKLMKFNTEEELLNLIIVLGLSKIKPIKIFDYKEV